MSEIVRGLAFFAVLYFVILFFIPKRWLPEDGTRAEWKVLIGIGVVTGLVVLRPELLGVVVLIWLGELLWHRFRGSAREEPKP